MMTKTSKQSQSVNRLDSIDFQIQSGALQLSSGVFPTTAAGELNTIVGQYFSVPNEQEVGVYLDLYYHDTGGATYIVSLPSTQLFSQAVEDAQEAALLAQEIADNLVLGALGEAIKVINANNSVSIDSKSDNTRLYEITLNNPSTVITPVLLGAGDDFGVSVTLILKQGTGANVVNWVGVKWPNGSAPVLSFDANAIDVVTLLITKNMVLGFYGGGWFE